MRGMPETMVRRIRVFRWSVEPLLLLVAQALFGSYSPPGLRRRASTPREGLGFEVSR